MRDEEKERERQRERKKDKVQQTDTAHSVGMMGIL